MTHPIIKDVLRDHGLKEEEFFGRCRKPFLVAARKSAAIRMHRAGLSRGIIARLVRREKSTIVYYIDKEHRAKRRAKLLAYYHKQKSMEIHL